MKYKHVTKVQFDKFTTFVQNARNYNASYRFRYLYFHNLSIFYSGGKIPNYFKKNSRCPFGVKYIS